MHIGQRVNEETLSINNPGGFLFHADLEKVTMFLKVQVVIIRADFNSWRTSKKIRLHQYFRVCLGSEKNMCPGVLRQNFLKNFLCDTSAWNPAGVHLEFLYG